MDKYEFCRDVFVPRGTAFLSAIRNALIAAGVASNRISQVTIPKLKSVPDYRLVITATRNSRSMELFIELTDATHAGRTDLPGHAFITLSLRGNNSPIATTYAAGSFIRYTDGDIDEEYMNRLTTLEGKQAEVITKARTALGV
jgi:hypothetical protein